LARPPRIGEFAPPAAEIGTVCNALKVSSRYCGVCMTIE